MTPASIGGMIELEDVSKFADLAELGDLSELADLFEFDVLPDIEIPDWEGEIRERAVIEFINFVRQTTHVANFARMALRFGCTMQQAYAVAQWFDEFLASYCISKNPQRGYIQTHQEPDWTCVAAEVGTTADVETWRDWMNRILEKEAPGKIER